MKRVLVTGAAGFIGSHLVDRLVSDGHHVIAYDDLRGGTLYHDVMRWWGGKGVEFHRHDLSNIGVLDHLPLNAVFHLASPIGATGCIGRAGTIAVEMVRDTDRMAGLASFAGCPLIYTSTSEMYGVQPGPAAESDNSNMTPDASGRKEYAASKLASELMLRNREGLDARIVRPFNVVGPRQRPDAGFVIPRWIDQIMRRQPITVYTPGTQLRAYCHINDLIDGMIRVWERGWQDEVYNLGNPNNARTNSQLADDFVRTFDCDYRMVDPRDLHGPMFREAPDKVPVIEKAKRDLDWEPTLTIDDILRDIALYEGLR